MSFQLLHWYSGVISAAELELNRKDQINHFSVVLRAYRVQSEDKKQCERIVRFKWDNIK